MMYSSRHSKRGRSGRRKKKSQLYTNFHCDPEPWQGSPPQTPPSSDDEQSAPVSVAGLHATRNASLRSGAAVAKAFAVAPTLSTKNRGRRINSVKRKISKYVKMQNANVLQNRQPARAQCTAPVPLPLFVKKKTKGRSKQTAPVPMPHHILKAKSKSKKKSTTKQISRTRTKAKRESEKLQMMSMREQIAQISLAKANQRSLVTANAPRNPNPMPMPTQTPTDICTAPLFDDATDVDFGLIPDAYFIGYGNEALLTTETSDRNLQNGSREMSSAMDMRIDEIQNMKDLDQIDELDEPQRNNQNNQKQQTKPTAQMSPQSNGSMSGAEIIANCCVSGQSGNNSASGFPQQSPESYNVLSDLTDFSISDGSHKNIEMELEREIEMELEPLDGPVISSVSQMDLIEMETVIDEGDENASIATDYIGDDKFNMLAQEIMFESIEYPMQQTQPLVGGEPCVPDKQQQQPPSFQMPPYQPYSQYTAGSSSTDYSYRYQCPVTTNIWAEPKRAQSAKTLAGLLMNGLEPISTKMFTL